MNKLLTIFFLTAIVMSCSDVNDPVPAQKNDDPELTGELQAIEFTLFNEVETLSLPEAMTRLEDEHAQSVISIISNNRLAAHKSFFDVPEGAKQMNGSTAPQPNVTYEWSWQEGSIFHKITSDENSHFIEILIREGKQLSKWYEGEQAKDMKSGRLTLLDPSDNSIGSQYDYEINEDGGLKIVFSTTSQSFSRQIIVNGDESGSITEFNGDHATIKYSWDASGNGTWSEYNEDGSVLKSGSWNV